MYTRALAESAKPGQERACKVDVALADGRTVGKVLMDPTGTATRPMTPGAFDGKFRKATRGIGTDKAEALLTRIKQLEQTPDVSALLR